MRLTPMVPPQLSPEVYYIFGTRRYVACVGLALVLFISALDSTIVAVALPAIGEDLGDFQKTSWIVIAYILTYTAFLPSISRLTDIVGRRPVLVVSTLFFMLWSGACGGAKTMIQLIVFRALQGIGGSAIYSAVMVTISTMVPRQEVFLYTSIVGAVFAASSVAGPLLGGVIVQHIHWGWIFFVNLPIGAIGGTLLFFSLSDPQPLQVDTRSIMRRIDWLGSFIVLAFSLLLCTPLGGTSGYTWSSQAVLVPLVLSLATLPPFVWAERIHPEPVVPFQLFRSRNVALANFFTMCLGAGFISICILLPERMQIVNGLSPTTAGVRMLPMLIFTGTLSPLAAAVVRISLSYRPLLWFGAACGAVGAGLLSSLTLDSSFSRQYGYQALVGISFGICITLSTIVVQFCCDRKDLAAAMGVQTFLRQIGGLIGVAISTALLNARVDEAIHHSGIPEAIRASPASILPTLPPALLAAARSAYSKGFSDAFVACAAWFAVGTLITLGVQHYVPPDLQKDRQSGVQDGATAPNDVESLEKSA